MEGISTETTTVTAVATAADTALISQLPPDMESEVRSLIRLTKMDDVQAAAVLAKFADGFEPFLRLREEALEIVVEDVTQTDKIARARQIDGELLAATKQIEAVHKGEKEFWLRGGQLVDGCKRIPTNAIDRVRKHLRDQIDYARRIEEARIAEVVRQRRAVLADYNAGNRIITGLGTISDDEFATILAGVKAEFEQKAEADCLERERLAILQEENGRLKRERDEAERKAAAERLERERIETERLREERERQAEIDRIAREKAEEERQIAAREAAKLAAPDAEKLLDLVATLRLLQMPIVSSPAAVERLGYFERAFQSAIDNLEAAAKELTNNGDCPF